MPLQCTCLACGVLFERKPDTVGKYCSRDCYQHAAHRPRLRTAEDRFWARVDRSGGPDACWLWQGPLSKTGRGLIYVDGRNVLVHRYAWTLAHGPIPDGMSVCHRCDVGNCVNWTHLWLGTQAQNIQDCSYKGRMNRPSGEQHFRAKLTHGAVYAIRLRYAIGGVSMAQLAAEYGVSGGAIESVIRHRTWKDLH